MNLEPKLEQVRQEYLRRLSVETFHETSLPHDETALQSVLEHVTSRTGKMLRPRLTLLAAATIGDEHLNSRRTLMLATAVEMLHNASLLHDDVIDRADTRRGQPSVNARWGNATAVLVGDWLLAQIMRLLDEVDDRSATRLVNRTVIEMVEAELLQQKRHQDIKTSRRLEVPKSRSLEVSSAIPQNHRRQDRPSLRHRLRPRQPAVRGLRPPLRPPLPDARRHNRRRGARLHRRTNRT